ncbi:hypothetical protein CAEBREN_00272 [Caenorhabditis brenneri]|uniref:Uncharacterized protein n=1 Tax=Caenorhabditis brenneri TaxID=135651 RepID=G0P3Z0_CAEBE|nr:hypothetical protein CAEBREN_00272 [Caenorhabditis brenneri]
MLMDRNLSKKSMIKEPTLDEEMKEKKPVAKKIQKVKYGLKKTSKPVTPPPIITPTLSKGYRIPKKKASAPTPGAMMDSMPLTVIPATAGSLKSIVVKIFCLLSEILQ